MYFAVFLSPTPFPSQVPKTRYTSITSNWAGSRYPLLDKWMLLHSWEIEGSQKFLNQTEVWTVPRVTNPILMTASFNERKRSRPLLYKLSGSWCFPWHGALLPLAGTDTVLRSRGTSRTVTRHWYSTWGAWWKKMAQSKAKEPSGQIQWGLADYKEASTAASAQLPRWSITHMQHPFGRSGCNLNSDLFAWPRHRLEPRYPLFCREDPVSSHSSPGWHKLYFQLIL